MVSTAFFLVHTIRRSLVLVLALVAFDGFGQEFGSVLLNNRVSGEFDAPIKRYDGGPPRPGAVAQLILVKSAQEVVPLEPATTFRTNSLLAAYYLRPVDVLAVGVPAATVATFRVRAWEGPDWNSASVRGESNDFDIRVGSDFPGPSDLNGLESFTLVPRLALTNPVIQPGSLKLTVKAPDLAQVVLQTSYDLKNWRNVSTNAVVAGEIEIAVPVGKLTRFYRAVSF